jgi:hypothetical protein
MKFLLILACAMLAQASDRFGWPDIEHECGAEEILHLETKEFYRINMQCNVPSPCNKVQTCVYSQKAICLGKHEFVAGVSEIDGVVLTICCEFENPPEELQNYACTTSPVADGEPAHMEVYDPSNHPPPVHDVYAKAIVKQG